MTSLFAELCRLDEAEAYAELRGFADSDAVLYDDLRRFAEEGSYFQTCPRDEGGHCLPEGASGATKEKKKPAGKEQKPAEGKDKGKPAAREKPGKEKSAQEEKARAAPKVEEPPQPSEKALRAKANAKLVDKAVQRYAEEKNELHLAEALGGASFPDSEPCDVAIPLDKEDLKRWQAEGERWRGEKEAGNKKPAKMDLSGQAEHGVEMKTMFDNSNNKLTMDTYSQIRKILWEKEHDATFHTVAYDDQLVFNALGEGKHDPSKRRIFYRRGVGSARVGGMYEVKDADELKKMMAMPEAELPKPAQRTDKKVRSAKWEFFQDEIGKGYKDPASGKIIRAKK